jgi:diaminopimelate epimerase
MTAPTDPLLTCETKLMQLPFTKMHALGNDFIVVRDAGELSAEAIRSLANRHTGIGFDQLLWLADSADADVFYRIFNADGGEVEQCGNGARCIARFLADNNDAGDSDDFDRVWNLEFPGGVVQARLLPDGNVAVTMGEPDFNPASLPFDTDGLESSADLYTLQAGDTEVELAVVSMGNPHAVIEVADEVMPPVEQLGPLLECHERFPNRANIGFMQIVSPEHICLRVYERGVGETSACGTGACAAVAVGCRAGKLGDDVAVQLPGGLLGVRWAGPGEPVWLIGEAVTAFEGVIEL